VKLLHILKSEPDENTKTLIAILSEGEQSSVFPLYDAEVDYDNLVYLLFQYDKVITWW
jgi:hypothetical protein